MSLQSILFSIIILVVLPASCVFQEVRYTNAVSPAKGIATLTDFLDTKHPADIYKIETFVEDVKDYIVVTGVFNPPYLALPAGPPQYIFAKNGRLIEWCRDSGDAQPFLRKWSYFNKAQKISAEDARKWVN
ncbi:MAG: hypothetical protein ACAI35_14670 [Candidatus Methylacidiphilales bacterium]